MGSNNTLANFPQFFFKKTSFFAEKPQFRRFLRNTTMSIAFCGKFAIIWSQKSSNISKLIISKYLMMNLELESKRKVTLAFNGWFSFYLNMGEK